jgi:hypothetical protein
MGPLAVDALDAARRVRAGADPFEVCSGLWESHSGLNCLVCDAAIDARPYTMIMPGREHAMMVAEPLCQTCADLPAALRTHRAERTLRRMWSSTGKQIHFR